MAAAELLLNSAYAPTEDGDRIHRPVMPTAAISVLGATMETAKRAPIHSELFQKTKMFIVRFYMKLHPSHKQDLYKHSY